QPPRAVETRFAHGKDDSRQSSGVLACISPSAAEPQPKERGPPDPQRPAMQLRVEHPRQPCPCARAAGLEARAPKNRSGWQLKHAYHLQLSTRWGQWLFD